MAKQATPRSDNMRLAVAQETARIMVQQSLTDFYTAKRKAAERRAAHELGARQHDDAPAFEVGVDRSRSDPRLTGIDDEADRLAIPGLERVDMIEVRDDEAGLAAVQHVDERVLARPMRMCLNIFGIQ